MLVVHHGSNISTCSRRISFTRLVIIPLVPGEKVSAVMFCKQFLAYAVHIDWCYHSIHKHSRQHAPYDDIGDASLRGSTSSSKLLLHLFLSTSSKNMIQILRLTCRSCECFNRNFISELLLLLCIPDLREAYRDRRLTTNFEL